MRLTAWNFFSGNLSIGDNMHLFETEDGDIWVCVTCGREREEEIRAKSWEYIFDRDDPVLRCKLCGGPDYEIED
jgi:rubrerythrin